MNELVFALCKTPVIGVLFCVSGACLFPLPLPKTPLPPGGQALEVNLDAPVSGQYALELISTNSGSGSVAKEPSLVPRDCAEKKINRPTPGDPLATPFRIVLKTEKSTEIFYASGECAAAWWSGAEKGRVLLNMALKKGGYKVRIEPLFIAGRPEPLFVSIKIQEFK